MRIFGRDRHDRSDGLQRPDALALEAADHYRSGDPKTALKLYVKAIHELHKMYVRGGMRDRQPGPGDDAILAGARDAFRNALAANPNTDLTPMVGETVSPLVDIGMLMGDGDDPYFALVRYFDDTLTEAARRNSTDH